MRKRTLFGVGLGLVALLMAVVFVLTRPRKPDDSAAQVARDNIENDSPAPAPTVASPAVESGSTPTQSPPKRDHPLLKDYEDVVLAEADAVRSTAGTELSNVIRAISHSERPGSDLEPLKIDYPQDSSVFPPEIVAPTFLWHEPVEEVDTWLLDVAFADEPHHLYVLAPGDPPPVGEIDTACLAPTNEVYQPTLYQASARSWTPNAEVWETIKQRTAERTATVAIMGFKSSAPKEPLSRGQMTITTSSDPVGAPIFYRDVPLAPARTEEGRIMPLGNDALRLINWRLRDISKPESRVVLAKMPTCANCHSFSADGTTLGMDVDGPQGDKGTYAITSIAETTSITDQDVITWNSFPDKPEDHSTIGFMSRVSPDGQYAVTTLNEELYVRNFLEYQFLQVFFPTRGILAYYSRETEEMKALPGADDPNYVHCDPAWTPDGETLIFARAEAKDPYPEGAEVPTRPNDPAETQIQYDLYRIPFKDGQGGEPEPIAGAAANGMSNTFPKVSPDGKWIVFVQCRNGQLLRPDSKLWIVPLQGGTARLMRCNTSRMNSWHSFSPNSSWLVFSSKVNTPYTQMFLTHIDQDGNDSPPILIPNSTAANRAVNLPEFANIPYERLVNIDVPIVQFMKDNDRGVELASQGQLEEALALFDKVLESRPEHWDSYINAGVALFQHGKLDEATVRFQAALKRNPDLADAHGNLGAIFLQKGMLDTAVDHLAKALKLNPYYFDAHANMASALWTQGKLEEASDHFRSALQISPDDARTHFDLGSVLSERGMRAEAVEHLEKAIEIDPRHVDARLVLTSTLAAKGEFESAFAHLRQAVRMAPRNLRAINELAWLLAVCPQDSLRDGPQSLRLAEQACAATAYRDPVPLSTLAAAYAEIGRFSDATSIATEALQLVNPPNAFPAQRIRRQLEHYQQRRPYRLGG